MGLKNEFETAVVNEPLVFEPLRFYCTVKITKFGKDGTVQRVQMQIRVV